MSEWVWVLIVYGTFFLLGVAVLLLTAAMIAKDNISRGRDKWDL